MLKATPCLISHRLTDPTTHVQISRVSKFLFLEIYPKATLTSILPSLKKQYHDVFARNVYK